QVLHSVQGDAVLAQLGAASGRANPVESGRDRGLVREVNPTEDDALPCRCRTAPGCNLSAGVESDSTQLDGGLKRPTRHPRGAGALRLRAGSPAAPDGTGRAGA